MPDALSALAVLPPAYRALFERTRRVAEDDARVRALWLGGSLARGDADAASDLDLLLAVADDAHAEFARDWRAWLARITPTLIARPQPFLPGSFYSVTTGGERLDVVVEPAARLATTVFRMRALVFDRDGLAARIPAPPAPAGPSPERIASLIEEFFRDSLLVDVSITRGDVLLANEGVHLLRGLLYQLFCEANAPLPVSGVKRWSEKLTPPQRALLEELPTGAGTLAAVLAAQWEISRAFLASAREIAAAHGVAWPGELEAALNRHLRANGLTPFDAS
jgi:hypothetical protein